MRGFTVPLYTFKCPAGDQFDAHFSMAEVPAAVDCPDCTQPARRIITGVRLAQTNSSAYQLLDSTKRSAHEPDVVTGLPAKPRSGPQPVTTNPLHQKLPKP
ncbi:zinc ribbon domain-containing protein [Micrococcoides hystricis]|uniref:Zinc ribbon domain-containing protein n=1 Tax=Micrococcoides hystricis TaxID=1572761 RepID=A0ABV6PCQ1_9MICC